MPTFWSRVAAKSILSLAFVVAPQIGRADTALDPVFGVKVSIVSMQGLLAAMPLPSLEKGGFAIPVQASYLQGDAKGQMPGVGPYQAKFEGRGFGLGFSTGCWSDLRFFAQGMTSSLKSDINVTDNVNNTKVALNDDAVKGLAYIAGIGYRLIGDEDSIFALGLIGGGALFKFNSHFTISGVGMQDNYYSAPTVAGPLGGIQGSMRIGHFVLNPYVLAFMDRTACKDYETKMSGTGCSDISASFSSVGLNLGWKAFKLTVYTNVNHADELNSTRVASYSLSFTFFGN